MPSTTKPTVLTKCVANHYTGAHERIIEFNDRTLPDGGGLISFRRIQTKDGETYLRVEVYRCGPDVRVIVPTEEDPR